MDFDNSAQVDALAKLPPEPPKPPERSAWTVVPRAITSGAGKIGAAIVEGVAAMSPSDEELRRNPGRTAFSAEDLGLTARSARDFERTLRPDPATASTAEQLVYGLGSGLTQAGIGAIVAGPAGAAAALGGGEGATVTDDLQRQGVDNNTARAAGAVTGVVNAASVALPMFGPTLKATAGLYLAGGPGGFMAQQALTSQILQNAGYDKIAQQFDPLDPLGLALSALVPLPFAGYGAMRNIRAAKALKAGEAPPVAPVAPEAPTVPRETVDAAMVHNLSLQRQAQEAMPPVARAVEVMRGPVTESPNFKAWFGESKVVDETGRPLVVYHGTGQSFDQFKPDTGWFTALPGEAEMYGRSGAFGADPAADKGAVNIVPAYVGIKRPRVIDGDSTPDWRSAVADAMTDGSIDGVIITKDGRPSWIVPAEPTQIKSAIGNSGDFNPASASLTDPRPVPPPAPKPDPAPAALAETIAKAQQELAAFRASGKTLDEYVTSKELPPAVNNLLIGLAETMKSPARAKALLEMVGKADAKADPANATADAVEAVRTLTDADLTNTPPETIKPTPDALTASVSERVAAVEATNPDLVIGLTEDGKPITVRDELARIRKEAFEGTDTELGAADADLVNVAANCALTNGG